MRKRYVTGLRPVGQEREGSPFGCTDMLGNRREFTQIPVRKELIRVQGGDMRSFAFRSATTRTFGKDVDKLMQHGFRLAIDAEGRSRSGARLSWRLQACAFRPRNGFFCSASFFTSPSSATSQHTRACCPSRGGCSRRRPFGSRSPACPLPRW